MLCISVTQGYFIRMHVLKFTFIYLSICIAKRNYIITNPAEIFKLLIYFWLLGTVLRFIKAQTI